MAMGECSAYCRVQANSSTQLGLQPDDDQLSLTGPKVNSRTWFHAIDNSTVNIILYIFYYYHYIPIISV